MTVLEHAGFDGEFATSTPSSTWISLNCLHEPQIQWIPMNWEHIYDHHHSLRILLSWMFSTFENICHETVTISRHHELGSYDLLTSSSVVHEFLIQWGSWLFAWNTCSFTVGTLIRINTVTTLWCCHCCGKSHKTCVDCCDDHSCPMFTHSWAGDDKGKINWGHWPHPHGFDG